LKLLSPGVAPNRCPPIVRGNYEKIKEQKQIRQVIFEK